MEMIKQFHPLSAVQFLCYIKNRAKYLNVNIDNITKLNRISYCCYGTVCAGCGIRLTDENFEGWRYGPLLRSGLEFFRSYKNYNAFVQLFDDYIPDFVNNEFNYVVEWIDQTIKFFGKYSENQLNVWTTRKDSPWDIATKHGSELYTQIPSNLIENYFKEHVL